MKHLFHTFGNGNHEFPRFIYQEKPSEGVEPAVDDLIQKIEELQAEKERLEAELETLGEKDSQKKSEIKTEISKYEEEIKNAKSSTAEFLNKQAGEYTDQVLKNLKFEISSNANVESIGGIDMPVPKGRSTFSFQTDAVHYSPNLGKTEYDAKIGVGKNVSGRAKLSHEVKVGDELMLDAAAQVYGATGGSGFGGKLEGGIKKMIDKDTSVRGGFNLDLQNSVLGKGVETKDNEDGTISTRKFGSHSFNITGEKNNIPVGVGDSVLKAKAQVGLERGRVETVGNGETVLKKISNPYVAGELELKNPELTSIKLAAGAKVPMNDSPSAYIKGTIPIGGTGKKKKQPKEL